MSTPRSPLLMALHYLFSHSGDKFVAHCLDLDIATSAPTLEAAEQRLNRLVQFQVATCSEGNERQLMVTAPFEYWKALSSAKALQPSTLEIEVPPHVLPVTRKEAITVLRAEQPRMAA